jgi:branched-chain amino acid transport system substrate-binding protein
MVAAAVMAHGAQAQQWTNDTIKIGVLTDLSSVYADVTGIGSVIAARLAVEDYDAVSKGLKVEIVSADHQNKADVGANITRQWIDEDKVDAIVDVPTSSVALAVNEIVREKNKVFLVSGGATSDLSGPKCSPNTVHWTYDTWALANGTGQAIVKTGGTSWFFITTDYAFGHALERDTSAVVKANGGQVLGQVRVPLNSQDFSSYLLQAQSSKAKIIGLANAGGDTINSIKQAAEFGIGKGGQKVVGLLVVLPQVKAIGLPLAQGLIYTEAWYWDMTESNRKWTARYVTQHPKKLYPTMVHAGVYASVIHYLKALEALKSDADGKAIVAKMKEMPTDDPLFGKGTIRADGRKLHPMYLMEVKQPAESKGEWDLVKVHTIIPADQAFRPLDQGNCPLVAKN